MEQYPYPITHWIATADLGTIITIAASVIAALGPELLPDARRRWESLTKAQRKQAQFAFGLVVAVAVGVYRATGQPEVDWRVVASGILSEWVAWLMINQGLYAVIAPNLHRKRTE